jgi:hypothetical protein
MRYKNKKTKYLDKKQTRKIRETRLPPKAMVSFTTQITKYDKFIKGPANEYHSDIF